MKKIKRSYKYRQWRIVGIIEKYNNIKKDLS